MTVDTVGLVFREFEIYFIYSTSLTYVKNMKCYF